MERIKRQIEVPADIKDISVIFKEKCFKLFIVGGAVRDSLIGKIPKDYDLATDATPDQVINILKHKYTVLEIGKAFGVVAAVTTQFPKGVEIATFRIDNSGGRRPDSVTFSYIEDDFKRRDLTINAMFYDIDSEEIVDLVGGMEDIDSHIVKTVGDPFLRFEEDPLRKLRAIRFANKMGYTLHSSVATAIKIDPDISSVSSERIRDEFLKILTSAKSVDNAISMLLDMRMLEYIFPNLNKYITNFDFTDPLVCIAMLVHNNTPTEVFNVLKKITYTSDEAEIVKFLISLKDLDANNVFAMKKKQKSIVELRDSHILAFCLRMREHLKSPINFIRAFIEFDLSISGDSAIKEGFVGKTIGEYIRVHEEAMFNKLLGEYKSEVI